MPLDEVVRVEKFGIVAQFAMAQTPSWTRLEPQSALRELIQSTPNDFAPMYRLARLQEDRGFIDAAEDILLNAKRQQPNEIEPYKMLVQFYARRVTAMHKEETQAEAKTASGPGERDENGVFRVGGPIAPPARLDVPRYPPDAQATGVRGVVVAEIVIAIAGAATDLGGCSIHQRNDCMVR
jgi:hypothetical protein